MAPEDKQAKQSVDSVGTTRALFSVEVYLRLYERTKDDGLDGRPLEGLLYVLPETE